VSETVPVYIDDACGSINIDYSAFANGLHFIEPGDVCQVPTETVAAWDAARSAWESAQAEMRQLLDQRRKKFKAEVLAYGRAQDQKRIERRERHRAETRARVELLARGPETD
jgi:hypothetical protein